MKMLSQENFHTRACNAIAFMKAMGFPGEKVKPILKNLLKVYDKKWEFIEAENYKTLVDAVLESDELDDAKDQLPLLAELDHGITIGNSSLKIQKPDKAHNLHPGQKGKQVLEQSDIARIRTRATSDPSNFHPSGDITEPTLKRVAGTISNGKLKVPKTDPCSDQLMLPSIEPDIGDFVPIEVLHPSGQPNPGVIENNRIHVPANLGSNNNEKTEIRNHDNGSIKIGINFSGADTCEIASSPRREIKLSLACDTTLSQNGFHIPDLDALFTQMENKCLGSYKIIEPNFSLRMLMQEICKTVLDLGTHGEVSNNEKSYIKITTNLEALKTYRPFDAPLDSLLGVPPPHHKRHTLANFSAKKDNSETSELQNWAIIEHGNVSLNGTRPLLDVNDISGGEESIPISIVNEVSKESSLPSFYYIPKNIVYQSAYVNFSLARIGDEDCCPNCSGDCLSSSIPCACARETGGEYAYTVDGLIKKDFLDSCISMNSEPDKHPRVYCQDCPLERSKNEPCKGHLMRKFIKECWSKCGCKKGCGNRVVQRGITCNLQVFNTQEGKGWGLRTLDELPRGSFVCEYAGEILTNTELYNRNISSYGNKKHTYPVQLDADWGSEVGLKDEEALCLDATFYGNVARFINHRCCDANLIAIPVEVETPDRHYYHLAFFTTRKVEHSEELTWDYGIDFDDICHPIKAFRCRCDSKFCRDLKHPHPVNMLHSTLNPKARSTPNPKACSTSNPKACSTSNPKALSTSNLKARR